MARRKTMYERWADGEIEVEVWEERDRLYVGIFEVATGDDLAHWWDDDARQMFDDGWFLPGRNLKQSIVEYAGEIGISPYPRSSRPRRRSRNPRDRRSTKYAITFKDGSSKTIIADSARDARAEAIRLNRLAGIDTRVVRVVPLWHVIE